MKSYRNAWSPKSIELEVSNERLTDAAGLGSMVDLFDRSPMASEFKKCLPSRKGGRTGGAYRLALIQLASLIYGHDCLHDLEEFRNDPYLEEYLRGETPAPRTLGDFLHDFEPEHLDKLRSFLKYQASRIRDHFDRVLPTEHKPQKQVHLAIDSTAHEQHGGKIEGCAKNYNGLWCLDSQKVFDETGLCRDFELRPGNTKSGVNAGAQIHRAFGHEKQDWQAWLSGDAAYCISEVMLTCTELKAHFTVTANQATTGWEGLYSQITNWKPWDYTFEEAEAARKAGKRLPRIEVGHFNWFPKWAEGKLCFPIVVKRTWLDSLGCSPRSERKNQLDLFCTKDGWKYYGVVTNASMALHSPQSIIERHNRRGNAENFIKEEKYAFDLKHFPCLNFNANFAYGLLTMVAHNHLRWIALIHRPDRPHFAKKLRRRFIFRAGKLVSHAGKLVLKVRAEFKSEVDRLKQAWMAPPTQTHPAPG